MNVLIKFLVAVPFWTSCCAASYDTRTIEDVILNSSIIFSGAVVGSGIDNCGEKNGNFAYYIIRVDQAVKGDVPAGDIKACGSAPLLLGKRYVIAGDIDEDNKIKFLPDSVLLAFADDRYYRLISYDSPIVVSDRGETYAVGIFERDFAARLQAIVGGKSVNLRSD